MYTTILTLYKQGISQRTISEMTQVHRKTIKKIITRYEKAQIEAPVGYNRSSKIQVWHKSIVELLSTKLSVVRIYEELCSQGFDLSYQALSHYIRKHKIKQNSCIRLHSKPGEEAQVDFGDVGRQYDSFGKLRKAYAFNMRLSHSRLDYYEVVFDQKISTWIQCHINAFNFFCGVPKVIKLDNLKSGVIDSNFYEPIFQKEYKRLADHYGCLLSPCRIYSPQEKGKVESGIKYVKSNFFAGRKFSCNQEMDNQLAQWNAKANKRIHGTTKLRPIELFNQSEKSELIRLPIENFEMSSWHIRRVSKDCHITLDNNYYSVPSKYINDDVTISLSASLVKIFFKDTQIAVHERAKGKGIFTTNESHYDKYKKLCPGFAEYDKECQDKIRSIGKNCFVLFQEVQKKCRDWYRFAKGIIKLRKLYDDPLIDQACLRALHYGITSYNKIKKILESNSYNLPLTESDRGR